MRKTILAILLALALVLIPVGNAFAASSVDVYVYATPMILSLTVSPTGWYINYADTTDGHSGSDYDPWGDNITRPNITYFSNPLGDNLTPNVVSPGTTDNTECLFLFTNNSGVSIDISCTMSDFVGGDQMVNGEGGYTANSDNVFGASGYVSGADWTTDAVNLSYSDNVLVTDLGDTLDIWWGIALLTQQDAYSTPGTMTSTILCTAAEHL